MDDKIAILVVTYNRINMLHENICALLNQTYKELDLFVIDNASTDGTEEEVQRYKTDERFHYYNTGKNLGGAGGFSFGLKKIIEMKYKYCWIMDDDAIPEKDGLKELIKDMKWIGENNFSFLASTVQWIDGSICKMNAVSIKTELIYDKLYACRRGLLPIKNCSFVGCFVNLRCAIRVGLPIKEFFIYGDDSEFTLRLSKEKQAYFSANSIIIHKMKDNVRIGIAEASEDRLNRYSFEYRNRVYIYRNHDHLNYLVILAIYLKECVKVILRSKNKKLLRITIILNGFVRGIKFKPQVEFVKMLE